MPIYYVTVGQKYRYEPHPLGWHPEGWVEVQAPDEETARAMVLKVAGSKWSIVSDDRPDPKYYPKGATHWIGTPSGQIHEDKRPASEREAAAARHRPAKGPKQATLNLPDKPLGDKLRDEGIERVLEKKDDEVLANSMEAWKRAFDSTAQAIVKTSDSVTAEEVLFRIGYPPGNPNAVGAAMRRFAIKNGLVRKSFENSTRPSRHSGSVIRWGKKESS